MKNYTIKEKKQLIKRPERNTVLRFIYILFSCSLGFLISFFGRGTSYIETGLITAIITLFGFGLTSTVFVYQAFKESTNEQTKKVINALSKTLLLTLVLIILSLAFDFLSTLGWAKWVIITTKSIKNASLIYAWICQIDILISFITILRIDKFSENKDDE